MALIIPNDIGRRLADLRTAARMTQAAVAAQVGVDQSRISRMENADLTPSNPEVIAYLEAVNTDDARSYLRYLQTEWTILPRPAPEVRELDAIWRAEENLRLLDGFEAEKNPPGSVRAEAEMHRQSLMRASAYLSRLDHAIAFV